MDPKLVLAAFGGVGIGAVSALTGTGGGTLLVPLFTLVLGLDIKTAIGTSLMTMPLTALSSIIVYRKIIDYRLGLMLELTTTLGAYLGAEAVTFIPTRALQGIFAVVLGYVSLNMLRRKKSDDGELERGCARLHLAMAASFFAGIFSGLLGIGGGTIKVPIMVLICNLSAKTAVATSMFMIAITSSVGALTHFSLGRAEPILAIAAGAGLVLGARVGAKTALKLEAHKVRRVFAVFLLLVSLRMGLEALGVIR